MISAKALIEKFLYALAAAWGYIWGTAGVMWTKERQEALNKTTDENREYGRKYGAKWIGHYVADCSGLFVWAFRQLGGNIYHGSNTIWLKYCAKRGNLKNGAREDGQELKPGTAVFVRNAKGNRSHIGLYVGNGTVVEASGTRAGVCTTQITNKKWVEWGELADVDYTDAAPGTIPEQKQKVKETIFRGCKGQTVKELQELLLGLGYDLGSYGADGEFGKKTEAAVKNFQRDHGLEEDGIAGPKTWDALLKCAAEEKPEKREEKLYTVRISNLKEEELNDIRSKYQDVEIIC